jgi:ATP-dependent Clp protease, protease subunit
LNPIITEQTEDGEISYDVFTKLMQSRILFLYGAITNEVAADIVATLLYLDNNNHEEIISLYINSEGGEIENIFMIYDMMKMLRSPIETLCVGEVFDGAALLLSAGTKGMRYATKNSIIRICQPIHPHSQFSNMVGAEIAMDKINKENKKFLTALKNCTGKTMKAITKDTDRDFYLTPKEAKKYGLIDFVIPQK